MFSRLVQILQIADLRKKIFFVLGLMVLFRLAAAVPVPGADPERLREFLSGSQFFGLLNLFSGGALDNLSIVMLGVGPYITGSIIMQLLTMIFPKLKEMYQEDGEAGRQKFNQYSRLLTVPLGLLQAYGLLVILERQQVLPDLTLFGYVTSMVTVVAGTVFLMWLGELMSEKNIGNGISLIIFAGIVSSIPSSIAQTLFSFRDDASQLPMYLAFAAVSVLVVAGVVLISEAQRNVPVQYAKQVRGRRAYGGVSTHLPLRLNQAGVIPIIFAISIILFPGLIGNFLAIAPPSYTTIHLISDFLITMLNNQWVYGAVYFLLVFVFTYFYTAVTFDPQAIADNVQKHGGFVLGIRPGRQTAEFLYQIINRITLVGGFFLGLIAILPLIVQAAFNIQTLTIGGTSVLIVVSVVLETIKQIQSQVVTYEYE